MRYRWKGCVISAKDAKLCKYVLKKDADIMLFTKITHLTREEFDYPHIMDKMYLNIHFDVRGEHGDVAERVPLRRKFSTDYLLFLLFEIFGGANESRKWIENINVKYVISVGTVSKYFRHALMSLIKELLAGPEKILSGRMWPKG